MPLVYVQGFFFSVPFGLLEAFGVENREAAGGFLLQRGEMRGSTANDLVRCARV